MWKQSARSWRSYGKKEDSEQSGKVSSRWRFRFWLPWPWLFAYKLHFFPHPIPPFIRELKTRRRRRQRKQQKRYRFRLAKPQLCTCITFFLYISLPSLYDYNMKLPICNFTFWGAGNTRQQLSFSFPELWYSPLESTPKKFTSIWRIKRDRISVIKSRAASIHFLSDVSVAVAVVGS